MLRRDLQRAAFGLAVVFIGVGCTVISGVNDYEIDRTTLLPDPSGEASDASGGAGLADADGPLADLDAGTDGAILDDGAPPSRRVFVTSASFSGSLGGLTGADAQCRSAAIAAGLGAGEWRAWLSTGSVDAISRLPFAGAYVLVNGTLVSNNATELASGTLRHAIDVDEYGAIAGTDGGSDVVWTSTDEHGKRKSSNFCLGWTSASYWDWGGGASVTSATAEWTNGGSRRCNGDARLYCFEQ